MNDQEFLIIGNGVAGTTAAEFIGRSGKNSRVVLVTDEPYPLYNRVVLPHFVKLMVPKERVLMRSLGHYSANGVQFLPNTKVTRLSLDDGLAITEAGGEIPFTKVLVASGGRPNKLAVPGADGPGVFNLQYLDDGLGVKEVLRAAKSAVAVGGGFIGYEFANAFAEWNLKTTWLIRGPRYLHRMLDEEAGALVDSMARAAGIEMVYGHEVEAVTRSNGAVTGVTTTRGLSLEADVIGCGLGLTRELEFLASTGVAVRRGVLTDSFLSAQVPNLFAAGDAAEFDDVTLGHQQVMGTWSSAAPQGRVAAINMLGGREQFVAVPICVNPLFRTYVRFFGVRPDMEGMDADTESISRLNQRDQKYRRLFFKDDRLVGATVIGSLAGDSRKRVLDLIRSRERVQRREDLLEV